MSLEIGTTVIAWNPGCENKATGTLVGFDGKYFKVEWTRTSSWSSQTYVGTFVNVEVA
jgi:hypothetical protein